MNDAGQSPRESSVLMSLAELRRIEAHRVAEEQRAEDARLAAEAEARAAEQRAEAEAAAAEQEAREQRDADERAAEQQRLAQQRAERIERERRTRVEAELALEQARLEAARSDSAARRGPRAMIAIIVACVLAVGGALSYAMLRQSERRASIEAKLAASRARSERFIADLRGKGARSLAEIAKLKAKLDALRDKRLGYQTLADQARKDRLAAAAAAVAAKRKRAKRGKRGHKKVVPVLKTRCKNDDPLCNLTSGKLFGR